MIMGPDPEGATVRESAGEEEHRGEQRGRTARLVREMAETLVIALVLATLIRAFVVASFVVDGISMVPTLQNGERLLINKFVYRLSEPQRGDVVVFRYPLHPDRDFIKRVMARGGETVEIREGTVYVDGQRVDEPYIPDPSHDTHAPVTVPPGHVYVMGDNRNNSEDSRMFGFVPLANIKGRAFWVYWPPQRMRLLTYSEH